MPQRCKIYIGSDYRGYELKEKIIKLLKDQHDFLDISDLGCNSVEQNDYNDYAIAVSRAVREDLGSFGILVCDSGHGMTIQANRFKGIRACNCASPESAKLAREHENSNILCIPSGLVAEEQISHIIYSFFHTDFTPNERREKRINRLDEEDYD